MSYRWLFLVVLAGQFALRAGPPTGYYTTAEGKAGAELHQALHAIIRNHNVVPYSSGTKLDTSDALKVLDRNPVNTNYVLLIYSGSNALASTFGLTTGWNREHQWCNSYGLDDVEPAFSDLHNLRAIDSNVNSSRGNKYYDFSDPASPGYKNPAHAEAALSTADSDSWQPQISDRGNIARSLFYMATRYTADATNEPALVLTDDIELIDATNSYMGKLSTLLAWSAADPVDAAEQLRNDLIYSLYQTNRNPFVDHPEWVCLVFAPVCTNPPVLNIAGIENGVLLSWTATNQVAHLEYAPDNFSNWIPVNTTPTLTNGQFTVLWTNTTARATFRLRIQ